MLANPWKGPTLPLILIVGVFMAIVAFTVRDPYFQLVMSMVPIWATVGLSWNLFSGYTGLISFGHATFVGLGAFTVAILVIYLGVSPWIGMLAGSAIGALASIVIGSITFRLRGHYFALAMLAYPSLFIFFFDWMSWQELSFPMHRDSPVLWMQFEDPRVNTLLGIVMMIAVLILTHVVERSRFGLAMLSIKQNEFAAEAAGINTFRTKMIAFTMSGALGGLVGAFYAIILHLVTPQGVLGPLVSAQALIITLFGGIGTLWGPVIGATVLIPLTEALRAELGYILPGIQGVIYGLTIMLVIIVAPEGVFWRVRDMLAKRRPPAVVVTVPLPRTVTSAVTFAQPKVPGTILLEVEGLAKSFGGLQAVKNVSFIVRAGSIVGIIGPNGAGKTTLFNLLNGFQKPNSGRIRFCGEDLVGLKPSAICSLGVGRTFQVARPFARMSVLDNVVVGALSSTESRDAALERAHAALTVVGLHARAGVRVSELTNLELRLMELARALASGPTLLLLDETLAGLGATEVEAILPVISKLPAEGVTVLIIEHTMHAMTRLAEHFVVLDHGQVIADGLPSAVMNEPAVIEAYLGKRWMDMHAHA